MAPQFPTSSNNEAGQWCPTGTGDGTHVIASEKISDKIRRCEANGKPFVSFEYFPPRTAEGVQNLYDRIGRMATQNPLFVDFTWGALPLHSTLASSPGGTAIVRVVRSTARRTTFVS